MFRLFLIFPDFRVHSDMQFTLEELVDEALELGEDAPVVGHHDVGEREGCSSFLATWGRLGGWGQARGAGRVGVGG